ncbi:MAG: DEAD/DEAH box helicase [Chloroflexi bacterium]|nr:DEAD/DEAH box helicase [Chloroflexota bacterium]
MSTASFLSRIKASDAYRDQIAHIEVIPPRPARHGTLERPLPEALEARLAALRLFPLYSHQASAVNAVRGGENTVIATPSASGKTLCYNIPVLEALIADKWSRALYLFPTKALAQDQERGLRELACPGLLAHDELATFDGDTPQGLRAGIKKRAKVVLTNPDMLHVGILPNHASWARFFRHLSYVVVDEAHVYRGVFGSHVALVLRRLRRLCSLYGASPRFIMASATLSNPGEHVERLVGLPFAVVDGDGAPYGGKDFVFWDPPLVDRARSVRRSPNSEATFLFTELVKAQVRSLVFARTRKLTELIYMYSRDELNKTAPLLAARIKPYRAGYLPEDRRQIEQELFSGELLGVVATTALELGVDIGDLDATVLTGYPGSISSTWQQAGRSGRRQEKSLSVLVALDNPLDQYLMRHPEAFFGRKAEYALINPDNPYVLKPHLLSAAWELPLKEEEAALFGRAFPQAVSELAGEGYLRQRGGRPVGPGAFGWYLSPAIAYPAQAINIRSTSEKNYSIWDTARDALLETVEGAIAFTQVHPGAIYLHQGQSYLITELDIEGRTAYAEPTDSTHYTQSKELTDLKVLKVLRDKAAGSVHAYFGEVQVTMQVIGYRKKAQFTEDIIGEEVLDLPAHTFPTQALWFDLPPDAEETLAEAGLDFAGGLHAAEHAAIGLLPLYALCDRNDIGGLSTPLHPDTGRAEIFIHDGHPGGIGIAEKGYELIEELWAATLKAITECPCQSGCPSCIQSPKCGNNNEPLDKEAAKRLLTWVLGGNGKGVALT